MIHKKYSQDLNTFLYELYKSNEVFGTNEEIRNKVIVSKLYYVFYHYILSELPEINSLTGPNKHKVIEEVLHKYNKKTEYRIFKPLKDLRIKADYYPNSVLSCNLWDLFKKVYTYIK